MIFDDCINTWYIHVEYFSAKVFTLNYSWREEKATILQCILMTTGHLLFMVKSSQYPIFLIPQYWFHKQSKESEKIIQIFGTRQLQKFRFYEKNPKTGEKLDYSKKTSWLDWLWKLYYQFSWEPDGNKI